MRNKNQSTKPVTTPKDSPVQSIQTPSLGSTFLGGIFQGFSFGTGSSLAHNLFRSGSSPNKNCQELYNNYEKLCLSEENMDPYDKKQCELLFENVKRTCFS